jgi:hypothetical protein
VDRFQRSLVFETPVKLEKPVAVVGVAAAAVLVEAWVS